MVEVRSVDVPEFDPRPYQRRIERPPAIPGRRTRNRAILVTDDGEELALTSGMDDWLYPHAVQLARDTGFVDESQVPAFAAHPEIKAVVWMRMQERRDIRLVVDSPPCIGPLSCHSGLQNDFPSWCRRPADPNATPAIAAYAHRDHDRAPLIVRTRDGVDRLLQRLARQPYHSSLAALYAMNGPRNRRGLPGHELRVGVDAGTGRAALRYMGGTGTWYSQGHTSARPEVCFYYMGSEEPFPRDSELSLDETADAIWLFLSRNGARPENIAWTPSDQPPSVAVSVRDRGTP